jgi:hypothetical protein
MLRADYEDKTLKEISEKLSSKFGRQRLPNYKSIKDIEISNTSITFIA